MDAEPLPRKMYIELIEAGVTEVTLQFMGGSDEGFLSVDFNRAEGASELPTEQRRALYDAIEEWAELAYDYSGAGDGTDYGDNIRYNLRDNTVTTQQWYHVVQYDDEVRTSLSIEAEEE